MHSGTGFGEAITSGNFTFAATPIGGVVVVSTKKYHDNRGYFAEAYKKCDFAKGGISCEFVQENQSFSFRGVLRGLHYQKQHPQAKLVRVLEGVAFDVAVDVRSGSPTFGRWHGEILSAENGRQLYLPHGCAHGILVLSEHAIFSYRSDDVYHPEDEAGLAWDDPDLAIAWPLSASEIITSEKDKAMLRFREAFALGGYESAEGTMNRVGSKGDENE